MKKLVMSTLLLVLILSVLQETSGNLQGRMASFNQTENNAFLKNASEEESAIDSSLKLVDAAILNATQLLESFNYREAQKRLEAVLPEKIPIWDKTNPKCQVHSCLVYSTYGKAFHLAGKAADAAGEWEKAIEYYKKSKDIYQTNSENVKLTYPLISSFYREVANKAKKTMEENSGYINELTNKKEPNPSERQQLELLENEKASIASNLKEAEKYNAQIDSMRKDAENYGKFVSYEEEWVREQAKQLENYRFKNNKIKFVEGIMSSKNFMNEQFPEKADKVRYLYRLNVLDPSNRKVTKEIEELTGIIITPVESSRNLPSGSKKEKKG